MEILFVMNTDGLNTILLVERRLHMALEWVWCPYCHKGEGCNNNGGTFTCPTTGKTFTSQQSNDDIKNR